MSAHSTFPLKCVACGAIIGHATLPTQLAAALPASARQVLVGSVRVECLECLTNPERAARIRAGRLDAKN